MLLFPEGSKVPIQEFKTRCFVTRESGIYLSLSSSSRCLIRGGRNTANVVILESHYLVNNPSLSMSPYHPPSQSLSQIQLPVLTTFIPSLAQDSPFRVSVHSWERPRPSRTMESLMQPDDAVLYEVRVYVDGVCVSGSIFNQRTPWPHIISMLTISAFLGSFVFRY